MALTLDKERTYMENRLRCIAPLRLHIPACPCPCRQNICTRIHGSFWDSPNIFFASFFLWDRHVVREKFSCATILTSFGLIHTHNLTPAVVRTCIVRKDGTRALLSSFTDTYL